MKSNCKERCRDVVKKPSLPMLMANWIFGMGIIEYPIGTQHRALSFFYTSIIISGYCSLAVYSYPYLMSMNREFEVNRKVMMFLFYSHILLTVGTIISGWHRSKGLDLIVKRTATIDQLLENIGLPRNYAKSFLMQIQKYVGSFIFVVITATINLFTITFDEDHLQSTTAIAIIVISIPVVVMSIVESSFINTVEYANHKFKKLNNLLKDSLTNTDDMPWHLMIVQKYLNEAEDSENRISDSGITTTTTTTTITTTDIMKILKTAKEAHMELVKLCREADETFGLHILMLVIVSIGIITGSLYHIYVLLLYTNISRYDFYRILLNACTWFTFYFMKIHVLSSCCSAVCEESIVTGDIISKYYDEPQSDENTQIEIRDFHIQLIESQIKFEAYGFITIDLTLIQSIIGSVTTYLMIFSQFGNFISPNCTNSTCT